MTFSYTVKNEIVRLTPESPECALSELAGIIHAGGELGIASIGYYIEIVAGNDLIQKRADMLMDKLYGVTGEFTAYEGGLKNQRCVWRIAGEIAFRVLQDCGLIRLSEDNLLQLIKGVDQYLVSERAAIISYIRGVFLSAGTVSAPSGQARSAGYHLGMTLSNAEFASDLQHLLAQCDIFARGIENKGGFIVYLKERGAISDMLALMGASRAVLKLNETIIERQVRNTVNRQTNFTGANISRSANAAAAQIGAIRVIEREAGLEALPESLKGLAKLRLQYPEYSMAEFLELLPEGITKSGVNHRFEKIIKLAAGLTGGGEGKSNGTEGNRSYKARGNEQ